VGGWLRRMCMRAGKAVSVGAGHHMLPAQRPACGEMAVTCWDPAARQAAITHNSPLRKAGEAPAPNTADMRRVLPPCCASGRTARGRPQAACADASSGCGEAGACDARSLARAPAIGSAWEQLAWIVGFTCFHMRTQFARVEQARFRSP
jgi:hypothetical protein